MWPISSCCICVTTNYVIKQSLTIFRSFSTTIGNVCVLSVEPWWLICLWWLWGSSSISPFFCFSLWSCLFSILVIWKIIVSTVTGFVCACVCVLNWKQPLPLHNIRFHHPATSSVLSVSIKTRLNPTKTTSVLFVCELWLSRRAHKINSSWKYQFVMSWYISEWCEQSCAGKGMKRMKC